MPVRDIFGLSRAVVRRYAEHDLLTFAAPIADGSAHARLTDGSWPGHTVHASGSSPFQGAQR